MELLIAVAATLISAAVIGTVRHVWSRRGSNRAVDPAAEQPTIAAGPEDAAYPVRLTCRDESDFHPQSGFHEIRSFEVFNHSDQTVTVKGFGMHIVFEDQQDWSEYVQATVHPPRTFPVRLEPNDALDGYIQMEMLGDDLYGRGLMDRIVSTKPYVDVGGYGEHNVDCQGEAGGGTDTATQTS